MKRTLFVVAALGWMLPGARADITLRQTLRIKLASFLPAEMQKDVEQQFQSGMPGEMTVRIKGARAYATAGPLLAITDYAAATVTLLNPKTKQYATVPLAEYLDRLSALRQPATLPPQMQQMMQAMRLDVRSGKTGQTGLIQGIRAEETAMAISMELPTPQAASSAMRMELNCWTAQPDEIRRVPLLKELADYTAQSQKAVDPTAELEKNFAVMPMFGDQMRPFFENVRKLGGSLLLKMRLAIHVPGMTQLLQLSPQAPAGVDADAPMAEVTMDVADISTAPVPESFFTVPADYAARPFEELAQSLLEFGKRY